MNEKWIEEIRHNDEMMMLDRYFPGKSCGNTECEQHCIEFCKIAERMGCMKKNEISSAVARLLVFPENCPALKSGLNHDSCRFQLFSQDRISVYDDQTGRRIIGKKYVSDADASKSGACTKCLEYANRIFKWPEEADKMPKLPLHPNCKCHYEDIYAPQENRTFQAKMNTILTQYINTKIQMQQGVMAFTEKAADVIIQMMKASSFTTLQTLRSTFRTEINRFTRETNYQIEILKETLYAVDFFLGFIAHGTPITGLQQNISSLRKWAKNIKEIYDDIKNIHYERLNLVIQQIKYLPKNPKEARSLDAHKEGWRRASDNENWYHRNNGGKQKCQIL